MEHPLQVLYLVTRLLPGYHGGEAAQDQPYGAHARLALSVACEHLQGPRHRASLDEFRRESAYGGRDSRQCQERGARNCAEELAERRQDRRTGISVNAI